MVASTGDDQPDPLQVADGRHYLIVALRFLALTSLAVTTTYTGPHARWRVRA